MRHLPGDLHHARLVPLVVLTVIAVLTAGAAGFIAPPLTDLTTTREYP